MEQEKENSRLSFPNIVMNFGPAWWFVHYGMEFNAEFWLDPVARTERWREQKRLLFERFGEVGLGEKDPQPQPVAGEAYGHRFMSAFWGCEIQYVIDQYPSALILSQAYERMQDLKIPELADSPAVRRLKGEVRTLCKRYGYCQAVINYGGPLNNAVSVFGSEIYVVCKQEPELARAVLQKMGEADLMVYDRLVCPLNGIGLSEGRRQYFEIGDCPVGMISPQTYQELVLPSDLWLRSKFHGRFGLHHCGIFEPYADAYRPLKFNCVDVGPGTDLRLTRAAYPNIPITTYLAVESLVSISRNDLDAMLVKLIADAGPAALFPTITVAEAGPEISDETVRDLMTARERRKV